MKKKAVLFVGFLFTLFASIMFFFARDIKGSLCGPNEWSCWDLYNLITILSFFGPALFISSLFIFRVSEEAFQKWKKFTLFSFLAYLATIVLMPWSVGDAFAGFTKGMAGLVLSILYLVVSLVYILILSRKSSS